MAFDLLKFTLKDVEPLMALRHGKETLTLGKPVTVDQEVAKGWYLSDAARLKRGGPFSVFEESDGIHKVDFWLDTLFYRIYGVFPAEALEWESVQTLKDYSLSPGIVLPLDFKFKIRAGHIPRPICYIDSPGGDASLRVLRKNPAPTNHNQLHHKPSINDRCFVERNGWTAGWQKHGLGAAK